MNKTNNKSKGVSEQASRSTSLYSNEQTIRKSQRQSSSALPTFFKWFKKSNHRKSSIKHQYFNSASSAIESSNYYSSRESLNSSPRLGRRNYNHINDTNINNNLSPSISCDSVISTSTTGFAFIKPNNYKPHGNEEKPKILIENEHDTDSIRRRMKLYDRNPFPSNDDIISNKRPQISLRRKYFLYDDSDTLKSNKNNSNYFNGDEKIVTHFSGNYDNIDYLEHSSQDIENRNIQINDLSKPLLIKRRQRQRRTVSDSSKDKKSGAYVHVKGKRKAPEPPITNDSTNETQLHNNRHYRTLTPLSTLVRKKRRAPPPPSSLYSSPISSQPTSSLSSPNDDLTTSILSDGLLEDKDIKALIDGIKNPSNSFNMSSSNSDNLTKQLSSIDKQCNNLNEDYSSSPVNDSPIISPRPWYKRSIQTNRDSVIPFKREIVLRTMEKRKNKQKEQPILPEVSYTRSSASIFDSGNKFGFFSRHKDDNNGRSKDNNINKEKRKSGIGMPNISELDREAAEIISKEKAGLSLLTKSNDEKYYNQPDHLILQQKMFEANQKNNSDTNSCQFQERDHENIEDSAKTTKDLISKFETTSNLSKITLNTSFIGRTEHFIDTKNVHKKNEDNIKLVKEVIKLSPIFNNINNNKIDQPVCKSTNAQKKEQLEQEELSSNFTKMTWSCPLCTLENPNWRIVCEVCERLKPYERISNQLNVDKTGSPKFNDKLIQPSYSSSKQITNSDDWEKKTEKVKKYFRSPNTSISKSSSDTSISQKLLNNKSQSPSKLPICDSPKLARTHYQKTVIHESKSTSSNNLSELNSKMINEKELNILADNEIKEPLVDSSVIITTVTPVFYAAPEMSQIINKSNEINLEEMRNARLAKFDMNKNESKNDEKGKNDKINKEKVTVEQISTDNNIKNYASLMLNDPNALELEKQRLRDKIREMNARALAEKYPVENIQLEQNVLVPSLYSPIPAPRSNSSNNELVKMRNQDVAVSNNGSKLGAIKKVFTKTPIKVDKKNVIWKNNQSKSFEDNSYEPSKEIKPKKVSSSAQTSGMIRKQHQSEVNDKIYANLNDDDDDADDDIKSDGIYSNIPNYENQVFGNDSNYLDKTDVQNEVYIKLSDNDKVQVQEISKKLNSTEGINDFKETLKNTHGKSISRTDTLVLKKIMKNLEVAIFNGKHEVAAKLAMDLAKMKVSLQVTKNSTKENSIENLRDERQENIDKTFIIDMYVEDRISQKGPIQITVNSLLTVKDLKSKAFKDFNIPIDLQRWLINDKLLSDDNKTLFECGIEDKSVGLYLYIIRPPVQKNGLSNEKELHDIVFNLPETSKAQPEEDDLSDENSTDSHNNSNHKNNNALGNSSSVADAGAAADLSKIQDKNDDKNVKYAKWQCRLCTLINEPLSLACSACSIEKPLSNEDKSIISDELKKFLGNGGICINNKNTNSDNLLNQLRLNEKRNDLNKTSPNRKSSDIYNIIEEIIKPVEQNIVVATVTVPELSATSIDFKIPSTEFRKSPTKINSPKRVAPKPNIVGEIKKKPLTSESDNFSGNKIVNSKVSGASDVTGGIKSTTTTTTSFLNPNITKSKYRGVDNFNPYRKDIAIGQNNNFQPLSSITKQQLSDTKELAIRSPYSTSHYFEILKLDTTDIVRNTEAFDCPICLTTFQSGEGCVLRDCLHIFCKECLANTIQYSDNAEVQCPYANREYSCGSVLQEREIRSLVTKDMYEKHLAKSVRYAEHQIENAFHCKTPNCRGWCIYEDTVNQFKCPVCRIINCLTCRVIHDGLTCKQYQDRLNSDCDSNIDARRTKEMLNEMVENGEAMNCPTCQVIMMKKWGCDWLKCSMCKTEVCWVTRGPRWGVAGKGDTSGGCKCGVNGVKCHPKCNYCH